MAYLTIELDGQYVATQELQTTVDLGRSGECGLCIAVSFLSRRHLRLEQTPEGWRAIDLGSTNGSWIGGRRITYHSLQDGEVLQFGNLLVKFHDPTPALAEASSRNGNTPEAAESAANPGTLSDDAILEILSQPDSDSIDEEPEELIRSSRRLDESVSPVVTRPASPIPEEPQSTGNFNAWEVAMKPTPGPSLQSNGGRGTRISLTGSGSERGDSANPSLSDGRWKTLLVRFETDLRFKAGVTLGIVALLGFGSFYWLQVNGFARPNEPRGNIAAQGSHVQAASPLPLRDVPV